MSLKPGENSGRVVHPSIMARERELAAISSFLAADAPGGRTFLLEGEAGIGKTALWRAGMEMASARGYRVLACTAAESETQLAFTTVRDLVTEAFEEVAADLPTPQRRALSVVLLREEPADGPAESASVAVAFLTALRVLASRTLTLLAIDDVQWVDPASADVVRYVLRRLGSTRVDALLARRSAEGNVPLPPEMEMLEVGPFSVGALGRVLHDRLGSTYPRPTLQRVHAISAGNPFYALEIARAIGIASTPSRAREPLTVPESLLHLVRDRLVSLPSSTFEALAVASALSRPTLPVLNVALGANARAVLGPAVDAEIVHIDGTAVWFAHPIFAASVYALAGPELGEIHARLAAVVVDIEERARHLVHAGTDPDEAVAAAVDAGAAAAAARGAPGPAAELAEAAARLTPPDAPQAHVQRRLDAVDWYLAAGDFVAARSLIEPLTEASQPGSERARVLLRLARTMEPAVGLPTLEEALMSAAGDIELQAEIQLQLVSATLSAHGARADLAVAIRAGELAELSGNRALIIAATGQRILLEALVGIPVDQDAVVWLVDQDDAYGGIAPSAMFAALWLMYRDRLDEARTVLEEVVRRASARGDEVTAADATFHLVELECRAGRYEVATERADQAMALELTGLDQDLSAVLYTAALVDAYRGRVEEARTRAQRGLELARTAGDTIFDIQNEGVLGFLDLSLGDARAAADRLAPLWPRLVELGYGEPSVFPVLPNAIHALLEAGDHEKAKRLLEQLETRGGGLDSAWALSQAARLRAIIAADSGRTEEALSLIDEALLLHDRMPGPFERGRTLLARGVILRRARRRRDARESLQLSIGIFDELGTPLWSQKAGAELARIGGRSSSGETLTPSEQLIAGLVAEGKTNKEVAAILVIADRSVESALTQIYRKLDVRSRTELARKVSSPD